MRPARAWLPVFAMAVTLCGCAAHGPRDGWEDRLRGNAIVLLGEVHDNAGHHQQRLAVLRRALAAGWRPAMAMEQFDRERQADIDRARQQAPLDAQRVIDAAAPPKGARGASWNWDFYRPFVALALEYGVPLIAANLSGADAVKIVRDGYTAVFDDATLKELGLNAAIAPDLQAAQEREIDRGHCNALPRASLPTMARGQFARDALMASMVSRNASQGVVLIAGNGHVRRDIGVPRWLPRADRERTVAVGYLEPGASSALETAFDVVIRTPAAPRTDPCIEFRQRMKPAA